MDFDFTNKPGASNGNAIPTWMGNIFDAKKEKMRKVASTEVTAKQIEGILLSNDPLIRLNKQAAAEETQMTFSRVDPSVTPHSVEAQTKLAAHWAGDSIEDRLKSQGDVVNDGDKVRDIEEDLFTKAAGETDARITKEHSIDRDSLWEVADQISEAETKKTASTTKEAKKGVIPEGLRKAIEEKKKKSDKAKGKDDGKEEKEEEDKEEKDEKKGGKPKKGEIPEGLRKAIEKKKEGKEDKEEKEASSQYDLDVRYANRHRMLDKFAKASESADYGKESHSVQFESNWYDEVVGDKTNIGNVKEASVDAGLGFNEDPEADGSRDDFEGKPMVKQNADETLNGDVENTSYSSDNYSKELGSTHKASNDRLSKTAHYNNRTQGLSDDGPTAPEFQKDPRDTTEEAWWKAQVSKSEKFYAKEQSILGGGKKEMHTDAIPVFEGGAEKKAWLANRQLTRIAMLDKVAKEDKGAGSMSDAEVIKYYGDAYGDKAYASKLDDSFGVTTGYKLAAEMESEQEKRANARRKKAGIDVPFVKLASDKDDECKKCKCDPCECDDDECEKCGCDPCECKKGKKEKKVKKASVSAADFDAITRDINKTSPADLIAKINDLRTKVLAPAPVPAAGTTPPASVPPAPMAGTTTKTQSSDLQMRKEARRQVLAQAYGEPVKEDYGNVGDPDWDASMLTRNAIVDSPQPDIIKQLDNAIKNVREAMRS